MYCTIACQVLGAHFANAIVVGDQEHIGSPVGEYADGQDARNQTQARFHLERIADVEFMDINDVVAVVCHEALAPDRLSTKLGELASDE